MKPPSTRTMPGINIEKQEGHDSNKGMSMKFTGSDLRDVTASVFQYGGERTLVIFAWTHLGNLFNLAVCKFIQKFFTCILVLFITKQSWVI